MEAWDSYSSACLRQSTVLNSPFSQENTAAVYILEHNPLTFASIPVNLIVELLPLELSVYVQEWVVRSLLHYLRTHKRTLKLLVLQVLKHKALTARKVMIYYLHLLLRGLDVRLNPEHLIVQVAWWLLTLVSLVKHTCLPNVQSEDLEPQRLCPLNHHIMAPKPLKDAIFLHDIEKLSLPRYKVPPLILDFEDIVVSPLYHVEGEWSVDTLEGLNIPEVGFDRVPHKGVVKNACEEDAFQKTENILYAVWDHWLSPCW